MSRYRTYGGFPGRRTRHFSPLRGGGHRSMWKIRLIIGGGIVLFALFSFLRSREYNPVTGEKQFVSISPQQEVALGLQAIPQMLRQYGGEYPDARLQGYVDQIGGRILQANPKIEQAHPWQFEFYLLRDDQTINAFALPGGQIFITYAFFSKLNEAQLAGVIGHEIGHVVARHGAQRMAKEGFKRGIIGAVVAASGSPDIGRVTQMVGDMVGMSYGRGDELQSDKLGVEFMALAGYNPHEMIGVMKVLAEGGGGGRPPEFFSTHPNPENRVDRIQEAIDELYPNGLPEFPEGGGPILERP